MFGERVGFLKFKADIVDKETGKMVFKHIHALLLNLNYLGSFFFNLNFKYLIMCNLALWFFLFFFVFNYYLRPIE